MRGHVIAVEELKIVTGTLTSKAVELTALPALRTDSGVATSNHMKPPSESHRKTRISGISVRVAFRSFPARIYAPAHISVLKSGSTMAVGRRSGRNTPNHLEA